MDHYAIILELTRNREVFGGLLSGLSKEEYSWKDSPGKWCLLEILCHLYDEEREDFRARTKHLLETPGEALPPIDPTNWVLEREYSKQDFGGKLEAFLIERQKSVEWLLSLRSPNWDNAYVHPKFGRMTARMFLSNWLVHDYIHIRQILKVKFGYLEEQTDEPLTYAGNW